MKNKVEREVIERRKLVMICSECGLNQYKNLLGTCRDCGGELDRRYDDKGKPLPTRATLESHHIAVERMIRARAK